MWISKVREDSPVSKKCPVGYNTERPVVRGETEFIGKELTDQRGFLVTETEGILGGAAPQSAEVMHEDDHVPVKYIGV